MKPEKFKIKMKSNGIFWDAIKNSHVYPELSKAIEEAGYPYNIGSGLAYFFSKDDALKLSQTLVYKFNCPFAIANEFGSVHCTFEPKKILDTKHYFIRVTNKKDSYWLLSSNPQAITTVEVEKTCKEGNVNFKLGRDFPNTSLAPNIYIFEQSDALLLANHLAKKFPAKKFTVVNPQGVESASFLYMKNKKEEAISGAEYAIEYLKYLLSNIQQHEDFIVRTPIFIINGKPIQESEIENMKAVLLETLEVALHAVAIVDERPAQCEKCGQTIPLRSSVLISPTSQYRTTLRHYHLCPPCFDRVRHYIADLGKAENRTKFEQELLEDNPFKDNNQDGFVQEQQEKETDRQDSHSPAFANADEEGEAYQFKADAQKTADAATAAAAKAANDAFIASQ